VYYSSYFNTSAEGCAQCEEHPRSLAVSAVHQLCAGRTGHLVNYNSLAGEIGIDLKTAKSGLGILQASYIVDLLQPYTRISARDHQNPSGISTMSALRLITRHKRCLSAAQSPAAGRIVRDLSVCRDQEIHLQRIPSLQTYFYRTVREMSRFRSSVRDLAISDRGEIDEKRLAEI
jgi:hypothetical protein